MPIMKVQRKKWLFTITLKSQKHQFQLKYKTTEIQPFWCTQQLQQ